MKKLLYVLAITTFLGCNNERVLLLPEIENAEVTEVLDVSPVYIFYDETQPDSTLFNRKNLIGTTNWLVNVDRRLTLRQAIPHIQYLQNKRKKESMHKNEDAKNYFTCNDTSIKNLGFLEFTDVNYKYVDITNDSLNLQILEPSNDLYKKGFVEHAYITISVVFDRDKTIEYKNRLLTFSDYISEIPKTEFPIVALGFSLDLYFDESLTFQDYISIKSELSQIEREDIIVSPFEFIY
ncbi:hypothetical protein BWZ20_12630 [Winogradskyella sp. J14-2]|uniref:hypothetical protein n=1 Tax=Winogradskyella sp. J14-2 TaxID=1936080 RepID=UPI0009727C01|nr:hypothetical protein [Winogradskyella sp. J14-2]APY09096.1 hypothetical protein BWZ20_12630 [Winogradskyella sp. J14-2]